MGDGRVTQEVVVRRDGRTGPVAEEARSPALGARNIMQYARVTSEDRAIIITDRDTRTVGETIKEALLAAGVTEVKVVYLESCGYRPFKEVPRGLSGHIEHFKPTVSFFAATTPQGEGFRGELVGLLTKTYRVRHIHMPGITEEGLCSEAMCADSQQVIGITHKVYECVRNAKQIKVMTALGTSLTIDLDQSGTTRWVESTGVVAAGAWGNVPGAEVFACPANVNGTFVTTLLGDHFAAKHGVLTRTPVTLQIAESRVVSVNCENTELAAELLAYLKRGTNTDRVGEFGIGTNIGITHLIGNMLVDEKAVGVHLAFGDPLGSKTGATWIVEPHQHCDMVAQGTTILVDSKLLMLNGSFELK